MKTIRKCHQDTLSSFGLEELKQEVDRMRFNLKSNHQIIGSLRIPVFKAHGCTPEYAENALWAYLSRDSYEGDLRDTMVSLVPPSLTNPRISHRAGFSLPERVQGSMVSLSSIPYGINQRVATLLRARIDNTRLWEEIDRIGDSPYWMEIFADWRGRLYTDSRGILSYQGDDLSRALTQFNEAKPVDTDDLKIFLEIIEDEYDLTHARIQEICADPEAYLDDNDDSKPCCVLAAALAYEEAETTGHSRYVLQQDATCSGFQHIAMFLRDSYLGKLVNILSSTKKRDLYKKVVRLLVKTRTQAWVETLAKQCPKKLRKQMAKPTVILTGYGSGAKPLALEFAGFIQKGRDHISYDEVKAMIMEGEVVGIAPLSCLKEIMEGKSQMEILKTCLEIAEEMQEVLFEIAPSIKKFIKALRGRAVSVYVKSGGKETFGWQSPNGMEVDLLGYRVSRDHEINEVCTTIDGVRKRINILSMVEDDCASQAPPCFVHTWDAHVIHEVALEAESLGIAVAMIHDSIGTHVCHARWARNAYTRHMVEAHRDTHLNNLLTSRGGKEITMGDLDIEACLEAQMVY